MELHANRCFWSKYINMAFPAFTLLESHGPFRTSSGLQKYLFINIFVLSRHSDVSYPLLQLEVLNILFQKVIPCMHLLAHIVGIAVRFIFFTHIWRSVEVFRSILGRYFNLLNTLLRWQLWDLPIVIHCHRCSLVLLGVQVDVYCRMSILTVFGKLSGLTLVLQ